MRNLGVLVLVVVLGWNFASFAGGRVSKKCRSASDERKSRRHLPVCEESTFSAKSEKPNDAYSAYLQQNANHPALTSKRKYLNQNAFVETKRAPARIQEAAPSGTGSSSNAGSPSAGSSSNAGPANGSSSGIGPATGIPPAGDFSDESEGPN